MRIVLTTGIYPPDIGGPATHSADLRAELIERRHEVIVVCAADVESAGEADGVVRVPRGWAWPIRYVWIVRWLVRNRRRFDIVYATGLHGPAVTGARIARRPAVVKVVGDPAWERGSRLGLTKDTFEEFQQVERVGLRVRAMRALRDASLRKAAAVVTPSSYLRAVVSGWVGPSVPVRVVPNGVRITAKPSAPRETRGGLRVLFVGRLVPHKHVDHLIDAVAAAGDVELEVVGDGPHRAALESMVSRLGVGDRVRFSGSLDHPSTLERMAVADAFVSASGYEGLPHVAIEALACGTPIVAPSMGGFDEVVRHGETGLLLSDAEPAAFADAFDTLRDDPELLARLSAGAAAAAGEWSFDRTVRAVEGLLVELVHGKPRAIFLAKTRLPQQPGPDLKRKLAILAAHLDVTLVNAGTSATVSGVRTVLLPSLRPRLLGGLVFYSVAPVVALMRAFGSERSAVVCQSPYEAVGIIALQRLLPRAMRRRVVVEVHGDWGTAPRLYGNPARRVLAPLSDALARWSVRRADRVRVIGDFTENLVRSIGYRGETDRFIAFSDFSTFLEPEPLALPTEPTAVFVGVLERYKGIDVLLRAWEGVARRVPGARLLIAGDGIMRPLVEDAVARTQGSITYLGRVPRAEVRGAVDSSMLLVLPSRSEGLGLVVLEAMARARPVIASDVGGLPEVVTHGHTGLVVPPGDAGALEDALVELLTDPERVRKLGDEGRRGVLERDPLREFESGIERMAAWIAGA